jgi:ribonuclease P protein component
VARSRARRLLRESFRQHQHELSQPVELVLVARPSIAGRGFAEVERDLLTALNRAGILRMTNS